MGNNNLIKETIELLESRGYLATEAKVIKNGVEFVGITCRNTIHDVIAPTVYLNDKFETAEQYADTCILSMMNVPDITVNDILNVENIKNTVMKCLVRNAGDKYCKPFLDMYVTYRFWLAEDQSIAVTDGILAATNITEDQLEEWATDNTNMISKVSKFEYLPGMYAPFEVLTNDNKLYGAGAMTDKSILRAYCTANDCDAVVIIPLSIHELLLVPCDSFDVHENMKQFAQMVVAVNETEVAPEEVLSNHTYAYIYASDTFIY